MSDLPYMPLYVAKYLGDTAHLTTLESGAYLALIFTYWMRQKPLPDDPVKLARIAKLTPEEWAGMADTLAELFQVGNGVWSHKRIEAELTKAKEKLEQATNAGKASAEARRNRRSTPDEPPLSGCSTDAEQALNDKRTLNHKVRLDPTLKTSLSERDARARENHEFISFWEVWPHKVNRRAAEAAFVGLEGEIDAIVAGVARYVASRSIDQQWPDPAKWLENRRWEDEPAPRAARGPPLPVSPATLDAKRAVAGKVYVRQDSPQGVAWANAAKRRGRTQVWDQHGGWFFPSEFPPTELIEERDDRATQH